MVPTDSHKHTAYHLNTLTNIACDADIRGEGVGIGWQKQEEEGERTAPYTNKEAHFH